MGEADKDVLRVGFDRAVKLAFHGATVSSDAGLFPYRDLDEAAGLTASGAADLFDQRSGSNIRHNLTALLRQSIYSRLAGYEDVNDAERLSVDPVMRRVALPPSVGHWTLTTLRDRLIKIGSKMVRHARYVTFQLAQVAMPRRLYRAILDRIRRFAAIDPRAAPT